MLSVRRILYLALVVGVALLPACNKQLEGTDAFIGSTSAANVVLEIARLPQLTPVATSGAGGLCIFTAPQSVTLQLKNQPKNSLAVTSPFNDIVVTTIVVSYTWSAGLDTNDLVIPVAGVVVPANGGTADVPFVPVQVGDLTPVSAFAGQSAVLTFTVYGRTVDGKDVSAVQGGAVLNINSCQL